MRFLILTSGSSGDVNPFIAIGRTLRERGHEVEVLVNAYFERQVREAGLSFRPVGEPFDLKEIAEKPVLMHHRKGSRAIMKRLVLPNMPVLIEELDRAITEVRPDVVFMHHIGYGGRWVCERRGVRCAIAVLAPLMWFSSEETGIFLRNEPEGSSLRYRRARHWLIRHYLRWSYDRPANRIRRRLGFSPGRDLMFADSRGGNVNLALWSPHFRGPLLDDPPNARICGFAFYDHDAERETQTLEMSHFLDDGDPPIVFTLGTSAVHVAGGFYEQAAEACRRLGRRGLLLTREPSYTPVDLPPGIRAFGYAAYSTVLPRGCATVHHGGIGTTAQALRAGTPMLVVPFAHDQFDNAARLSRLGVSLTLHRNRLTSKRLAEALAALLDDAPTLERAAGLRRKLLAEDGAARAADELEKLAGCAKLLERETAGSEMRNE